MTKRDLNQNAKYVQEFIDDIETNFVFNNKPINRFKSIQQVQNSNNYNPSKNEELLKLKIRINSIKNCKLKNQSKNLVMGDGNTNSPLMIIGDAPGELEDSSGLTFQGDVGKLLSKMLLAINIKKENIYLAYSINFRLPEDRSPTSQELKTYSTFLKEHISIINPKIIILMGGTAMEAVTGSKKKISDERGRWREIILKNKTFPVMTTFSPSYILRFPQNKKYSWEDLKKIRSKIQDLKIKI